MSTNTEDESFHPLGEEWESELTSMLDDTEYDTELGLAMAEDAQRLVAGEITEAEFHEKYHEEVLEEFGEDERPTAEALEELEENDGGFFGTLASLGDGDQSRREVMKKMGVGGTALGLGAMAKGDRTESAAAAETGGDDDDGVQWGMTIDLEYCDGCLSCMTACGEENNLDEGVNWMYVMAYEDENVSVPEDPGTKDYPYVVRPCQHCDDAPCEKVCPTTARHTRNKDGLVLTDYDVCIGCRYCQVACPYGVNYFQWDEPDISQDQIVDDVADTIKNLDDEEREQRLDELGLEDADDLEVGDDGDHIHDSRGRPVDSRAPRGVMSKCTMCPTRQDGQMGDEKVGTTACMEACTTGAIQFGNVNDESSDPSIYAEYPALGRALRDLFDTPHGGYGTMVGPEDIEEALGTSGEASIEDAIEALNPIDLESLSVIRAIVLMESEVEFADNPDRLRSFASNFERARATHDALQAAGIDFDSEEVRRELRLGEETVEDAKDALRDAYGTDMFGEDTSKFQLLGDVGTNPNVTYLGHEPGPHAHQVEGPVDYGIGYARADGSEALLVSDRMEVIDEETVRGF